MRGWLSAVAREREAKRQVAAYRELGSLFDFFADFEIAPFDDAAVERFEQFNRIRMSDRKIAAIALANDALLLTANRRDYELVTGLRFENWMDEPSGPPAAGNP